jgi:hypothetical protein
MPPRAPEQITALKELMTDTRDMLTSWEREVRSLGYCISVTPAWARRGLAAAIIDRGIGPRRSRGTIQSLPRSLSPFRSKV